MKVKSMKQDIKLIAVPMVFLLLRMWSILVDVVAYYLNPVQRALFQREPTAALFILLEVICLL